MGFTIIPVMLGTMRVSPMRARGQTCDDMDGKNRGNNIYEQVFCLPSS